MKPSKTSKLTTSVALLLAAGLLSGCGDEAEDSAKPTKEFAVAPVQSVETVIEPGTSYIDEIESIDTLDADENILDTFSDTIDELLEASEEELTEIVDAIAEIADDGVEDTQELYIDTQEDLVEEAAVLTDTIADVAEETVAVVETTTAALTDDATDLVNVNNDTARALQQALANAGFDPGPADGLIGNKTLSALKSYQQQNGLPTGGINKASLRALGVNF